MLVLTRRLNERLVFPTLDASVEVVGLKGGAVRLGVRAPGDVPVFREEVLDDGQRRQFASLGEAQRSAEARLRELAHFIKNRLNTGTIGLALLRGQLRLGRLADAEETLARMEQDLGGLRQGAEALSAPPAAGPVRRALLVEDDHNERELLAGLLRLAGLAVVTADDGAEALARLEAESRPDVLLLDMLLPRLDGPSLVRAVRRGQGYAGLTILGMTGADPTQFGLTEGPDGVNRWFRKPLNPEELLRHLQELAPTAA
jgi:carbon storage regulator CsrA